MLELRLSEQEKAMLQNFNVECLVLFGSHAQGTAGLLSDIDIGILAHPSILKDREQRNNLYDALYDMISARAGRLTDIDLVFLQEAPMELQSHVAQYGIPLYERSAHSFPRFREYVMDMYADFAPFRQMFHRAILSRIS